MDTYADKNYRLLFDTEGEWYCNDARTIEPERMPDFDLLCAGFPCQAFSIAGKREGFADARGTLFFEIARLLKAKRPQYFILENVPGLLSHDKGRTFCTILSTLSQLGYHVEWKVLNSKDFGVPQARKRVYIVGYFDFRCAGKVLPEPETNGAALVQVRAGSQGKRVYSPKGLSCTLTSQAGGMGGKTGLYDVGVPIKENTKLGYKLAREGDSIDLGYANLNSRRGRLTIYSIYYVSMIPKVQEYGKLKAIGSTKRQIRQMVFREGMLVTALALPVGLLISSFLSRWIMKQMITFMAGEDPLMQVAAELVKNGEVSLLHWWIYAITIMAVLFTSAVSLAKPMRIAAKVSPIEAMRYQGLEKRGKKVRKGYQNLTIFRLTKANMVRNKKRTGITIVTLGATGILFMVVATILSCAAPKEIARKDIESDYKIKLETWGGDKMNPDRDWRQVQQNNPLTKAFIDQVRDVDGVEEVKVKTFMNGKIPKLSMDGEIWDANIIGLDASYAETLEKGEIQGHVTYEELEKGDKILMSANMLYWFPELKVGDSLKMVLNMGDDQVEKTFEIGAIGDYYASLGGSSFYLPQSVLEKMNPNNLNYILEITVNDQKKNSAYQELQALADNSEYLVTGSYEEQLQEWEKNMRLTSVLCYAFLIILGGIGIMNLVNTMMNSIYTRRRELGMIQAIGMSEKQLIRMLQLEGIIYTLGTLAVSVGIGSLVGYGAFLYAKTKHMFQISEYHFPVVPAVLLICVVAFLQVLLTYGVSANFRKLSLIDRIRYAE